MATTLTDNVGKITIVIGATTYNVKKSDIKSVVLNSKKGRIEMRVASGYITGNHFFITFSDVTTPDSKAIASLFHQINNWWKEPASDRAVFEADAGQTIFDTTPRINLGPDPKVLVAGVDTTYGWTQVGNIITFGVAMDGGEEIIITN